MLLVTSTLGLYLGLRVQLGFVNLKKQTQQTKSIWVVLIWIEVFFSLALHFSMTY